MESVCLFEYIDELIDEIEIAKIKTNLIKNI